MTSEQKKKIIIVGGLSAVVLAVLYFLYSRYGAGASANATVTDEPTDTTATSTTPQYPSTGSIAIPQLDTPTPNYLTYNLPPYGPPEQEPEETAKAGDKCCDTCNQNGYGSNQNATLPVSVIESQAANLVSSGVSRGTAPSPNGSLPVYNITPGSAAYKNLTPFEQQQIDYAAGNQ